ncbi:MAG: SUF system NifU family Fe-S cluster assembly protein [Burkholderiaceae bacterium]
MNDGDALSDLYQELVLEHKRSPRNFGPMASPTHEARGTNPQCGDDVKVQLRIDGERIEDIRFTGNGCAICMASTSMMTEAVKRGDVPSALELQERFRAVMTGKQEAADAGLGKLISFAGVRRYPSRIKCVLLGWHALNHAITDADGVEKGTPA